MTSILTNSPAMAAALSLWRIDRDLMAVQKQISTGKRVSDAADDPAIFVVGQRMKADLAGIGAVREGMSSARATLGVMRAAGTQISDQLNELKKTFVEAQGIAADPAIFNEKITKLLEGIDNSAQKATYMGTNLLVGTPMPGVENTSLRFLTDKDGASRTVAAQPMQVSDLNLTGLTAGSADGLDRINAAIKMVNSGLAEIGGQEDSVMRMDEFQSNLADAMTTGLGVITDADMVEANARLESLLARQQLAAKSLSIANDRPRLLLQLFG